MVPRSCASTGEGGITQTRGVEKKKKNQCTIIKYTSRCDIVGFKRIQEEPGREPSIRLLSVQVHVSRRNWGAGGGVRWWR